jgi:hypothetical protein
MRVPPVAQRLGLALAASLLAGVVGACQGPDPFYRNRPDGGGLGAAGAPHTGFAGTTGGAGGATSGSAGATSSAAGASGTAGSGASGTAGSGASGTAGSGASGTAGAGTAGASGTAGAGTAGASGTSGTAGAGGSAAPCTKCMVKVEYTCRSDDQDTGQASFVLDVTNEASTSLDLSSLTLRYWYTVDAGKEQELDCDFAKLGCTNLVTSADTMPKPMFVAVMPPKPKANEYAEIAFKAGALALDSFLDTGEIQLRLHNKDYSPITQVDDYSHDCLMKGNAQPGTTITAYVDGVLVWGTEPQ